MGEFFYFNVRDKSSRWDRPWTMGPEEDSESEEVNDEWCYNVKNLQLEILSILAHGWYVYSSPKLTLALSRTLSHSRAHGRTLTHSRVVSSAAQALKRRKVTS